jgi:hypothetical protein
MRMRRVINMQPPTSPYAYLYKICDKCKDAWVEHPWYNYCPPCMNDFYISQGLKPMSWITRSDGITVGFKYSEVFLDP